MLIALPGMQMVLSILSRMQAEKLKYTGRELIWTKNLTTEYHGVLIGFLSFPPHPPW